MPTDFWFCDRPTLSVMCELLSETKAWQDGLESQRTLWDFVAAMLDRSQLVAGLFRSSSRHWNFPKYLAKLTLSHPVLRGPLAHEILLFGPR
jgi:hypothetical protein